MSAEERKFSVDGHVYRYGLVNGARCWYTGYSCKVAVDDETERLLAALSTAERERDELHQQLGSAIDVARETMTEITTGRLASIGGIENTYCPQISVSRVKKLHERLVALADSYRARVPSGGEEGR